MYQVQSILKVTEKFKSLNCDDKFTYTKERLHKQAIDTKWFKLIYTKMC